jgi:hypothetical protein
MAPAHMMAFDQGLKITSAMAAGVAPKLCEMSDMVQVLAASKAARADHQL